VVELETFYRVLLPESVSDHISRWKTRKYASYHHSVPDEWRITWRERRSTDKADYKLDCRLGTFSPSARSSFLRSVGVHGDPDRFSEEERKRASELAGVCAFRTPEAAVAWARDSVCPDRVRIVDLIGRFVCSAPEDQGVVAEVVEVRAFGPLEAFRRRHRL
jgi:hypothetical protein